MIDVPGSCLKEIFIKMKLVRVLFAVNLNCIKNKSSLLA